MIEAAFPDDRQLTKIPGLGPGNRGSPLSRA